MERFHENGQRLLVVNYFRKKCPLQMFDRPLSLYKAGFFEFLKCRGGFLACFRKFCIKDVYTLPESLEAQYNTSLGFNKNFNISHVIKLITSAFFSMTSSFSIRVFCLTFSFFCLKSTVFSNDLNLYQMYCYIFLMTPSIFKTQGRP